MNNQQYAILLGIRYSEEEEITNFREFFRGNPDAVEREFYGLFGLEWREERKWNNIVSLEKGGYDIPLVNTTTTHLDGTETMSKAGMYMRIVKVEEQHDDEIYAFACSYK